MPLLTPSYWNLSNPIAKGVIESHGRILTGLDQKAGTNVPESQRLSAMIPGNMKDCRKYGVDPESWLEKGIVDDLIPTGTYYNQHDVHVDGADSLDFQYFSQLKYQS